MSLGIKYISRNRIPPQICRIMGPSESIIIPHHNTPDLLKRCLLSIPKRDDVQVIVVDDKSDDSYLPAVRKIQECFSPWEFIYLTEGKGAGHARNVGIDYSKGDWLLFADSDDYFVSDFSSLLDRYYSSEEDIIYFRNLSVLSDDTAIVSHRDDWVIRLFDQYSKDHNDKRIRCNHCVPWGKIIRRSYIIDYHIRFDEVMYSNDVMFALLSGCSAKSVAVINRPIYVLTEREGSLTSQFASKPKELAIRTDVCFRAYQYIQTLGEPYISLFSCMALSSYLAK